MKLEIKQIGDPVLETKAKPIKHIGDSKIQKLIDDMLDTCIAEKERAAGLSAPQVGKSERISICRRVDLDENSDQWEVMINPEIVKTSKEETIVWEGCLSIGLKDKALYGPVSRPEKVKVQYLTREGEKRTMNADDYFSHVVQHEIDHLNGILFLTYVPNPEKNIWISKELDQYLDQNNHFPAII